MADYRLATVVEEFLTDANGKLIESRFDADTLEAALDSYIDAESDRKTATNILSYYRDSGIVEPRTHGGTIVGIASAPSTANAAPSVARYTAFRLRHLRLAPAAPDDVTLAVRARANEWINLTVDEFRGAVPVPAGGPAGLETPPEPPEAPAGVTIEERPVGELHSETFAVAALPDRVARRIEQPLVLAYKDWMKAKGSDVISLRYKVASGEVLICDAYDKTRNNLLEAKGTVARTAIRMAIGQLIDYRRFLEPTPNCAVLLPQAPTVDDAALIHAAGFRCVWLEGEEFKDDAGGEFV